MSKEEVIMTKMTVHEALCEIKVADKRIEKAIQECAFCEANKEISPKINGITRESKIPEDQRPDQAERKHQESPEPVQRQNGHLCKRQGNDHGRSHLHDAVRHQAQGAAADGHEPGADPGAAED